MSAEIYANPRAARLLQYAQDDVLSADGFGQAKAAITAWPRYAPTPLVELPGLARALGIERLWYKDEAWRFGLKSFKALGGAYAVERLVRAHPGERPTVTAATDGNHGRAVAWGAQLFGCRCVIFIHEHVSAGRAAAIAGYGAEVIRVSGTYDDSVRRCAAEAERNGWVVVSDTSYEGYTDIPRDVMHGYGVMADETRTQLGGSVPTHAFAHAGVGALAAAVCARFWQHWAAQRPRFVVVEPEKADGLFRSARAGRPTPSEGDLDTVMAGLSCAEISPLAWRILETGADHFMTIEDSAAIEAMRVLADGRHGDAPRVGGETGVAGLAGLMTACADPRHRLALALTDAAQVLVIGSEGDTDPEIYRKLVGRSADEVRGGKK
jgi:diaminopropionate ammonia-lyase